MYRMFFVMISIVMFIWFSGCQPETTASNDTTPAPIVKVTGITISAPSDIFTIGTNNATLQLTAVIAPINASDTSVLWSITNTTGSASISTSGLVTAIGNGSVIVKALANDGSLVWVEKEIIITGQTVDTLITGVTINGDAAITTSGGEINLTADILPVNAELKKVDWVVINGAGSASVKKTGDLAATVKALSNGTVTIQAIAQDGSNVVGEKIITITGQPTPGVIEMTLEIDSASFVPAVYVVDTTHRIHYAISTDKYFLDKSAIVLTGYISEDTSDDNYETVSLNLQAGTYYLSGYFDMDGNSGSFYMPGATDPIDHWFGTRGSAESSLGYFECEPINIVAGQTTNGVGLYFTKGRLMPVNPGILKLTASYSGTSTVDTSHKILAGVSTDQYLAGSNNVVAGLINDSNNMTKIITVSAGSYYIGGFYDKNGNMLSATFAPDGGDPVGVYNGKIQGVAGDPIVVTSGGVVEGTFTLSDTIVYKGKYLTVFCQNDPNTTGNLYQISIDNGGGVVQLGTPLVLTGLTTGSRLKPMGARNYDSPENLVRGNVIHVVKEEKDMDSTGDRYLVNDVGTLELIAGEVNVKLSKIGLYPDLDISILPNFIPETVGMGGSIAIYSANYITGVYGIQPANTIQLSQVLGMGANKKTGYIYIERSTSATEFVFDSYKISADGSVSAPVTSTVHPTTKAIEAFMTFDSTGKFGFGKDIVVSNTVASYSVSATDGSLTRVNSSTITDTNINRIAEIKSYNGVSALYIDVQTDTNSRLFKRLTFNSTTGTLGVFEDIGELNVDDNFIMAHNGKYAYVVSNGELIACSVNSTTGDFTKIETVIKTGVSYITVHPDDSVLFVYTNTGKLQSYVIDLSSGKLTKINEISISAAEVRGMLIIEK
ncbi:MAG TPA: hypothetical protein DDY71_08135 [Spirochaetia bacterium]|nr:MAG: hypothetical protein A2Y30_07170 [Spirochaetes bacterium GWE1_32_154]OHD45643.1 MAG: hypothetical protein A2Y29_15690 [Spirochaetes bacterium GWE2_31_10]HBD95796.1 hypothetical protein [Spirochaetia bacterium]HBI37600.1 hypothetical protein [Spirochaetia bacterium]